MSHIYYGRFGHSSQRQEQIPRPLHPSVRLLYMYNGHRFTGTVLQAGMYCIRVRVENSIQEHFIEYRDILDIGEEEMGLK